MEAKNRDLFALCNKYLKRSCQKFSEFTGYVQNAGLLLRPLADEEVVKSCNSMENGRLSQKTEAKQCHSGVDYE